MSSLSTSWKQRGKLKPEVKSLCGGELMRKGMELLTQLNVSLQTVLYSWKMPHSVCNGKSRDFLCSAGGTCTCLIGMN
jgi:hypothetical protein